MPRRDETLLAVLIAAGFIIGFLGAQLVADTRSTHLLARDTRNQVLALAERVEGFIGKVNR